MYTFATPCQNSMYILELFDEKINPYLETYSSYLKCNTDDNACSVYDHTC